MKLVTVQFPDTVNTSVLPIGKTGITVSDGTNGLSNGTVMSLADVIDPPTLEGNYTITPVP